MSSQTQTVEIVVNGQKRPVPAGATVEAVLLHLEVPLDRVAVELNRRIVRRPDWGSTPVPDGGQLEIVQFVGGG
ncbi:MAG: sulfur carrier protein ThiS [Bryobacteraceae bacterium]|nr:sulfur carrier protein ThiS [Bryobacteraceae bacterium]